MRFINFITEQYIGLAKIPGLVDPRGDGFSIFINPTPKELIEFREEIKFGDRDVRFIIDNKKKRIFVTSSGAYHPELLSWLIRKSLVGRIENIYNSPTILAGTGVIKKSGRMSFDGLSYEIRAPDNIEEFYWASKYFPDIKNEVDVLRKRRGYTSEEYTWLKKYFANEPYISELDSEPEINFK